MKDKEFYTTGDISRWCGVPYITIVSWIKAGKVEAAKTPGGHRRIKRSDFVDFLARYGFPIPEELKKYERRRILIVDDEPAIIEIGAKTLKLSEEHYEIASARNGFKAAMAVVDFKPDLIVLDINIPGIDGIEVCEHLKDDDRTRHIKILGITATGEENINKLLQAGADVCLRKPLKMAELERHVKELLQPKN